MTDSDEDSFHSASEGEDLEVGDSSKLVIVLKKEATSPSIPKVISTSNENKIIELNKTADSVYDDANQSAEWDTHPLGQQVDHFDGEISKESEKSTPEDGWEDFGDEADTEGDSDVEKIESDEGEYYHRQMLDKKLMPPPPLPTKNDDSKETKNSGGLFDWSAIHNVVNAVGEGFSSVVETGLGLPPPEEAARLSVAQRRKLLEDAQQIKEPEPSLSSDEGGGMSPEGSIHGLSIHHQSSHHKSSSGGFSGFLGGFGSIVNGSLDVLETLGKKTFETLTVKDETEKRRFILQPGKETNLSEILRELKESEDASPNSPKMMGYGTAVVKNTGISFLREFEENDGLVHLECFELLSKDYFAEKVADKQFLKFDEKLNGFCLEDVSECNTEDFAKGIKKQISKFNVGYKPTPLVDANNDLTEKLKDLQSRVDKGEEISIDEFHRLAVFALAKLTSKAIESLCRLVQQMLVSQQRPDLESIFTFTYLICRRLSFFASQYANLLSLLEQTSKVEEAVTNIFFECSNACLYLKKALELARPFFTDDGFIFNPNFKADIKPEDFLKPTKGVKKSNENTEDDWENW